MFRRLGILIKQIGYQKISEKLFIYGAHYAVTSSSRANRVTAL
jgi:hypothetical protein